MTGRRYREIKNGEEKEEEEVEKEEKKPLLHEEEDPFQKEREAPFSRSAPLKRGALICLVNLLFMEKRENIP